MINSVSIYNFKIFEKLENVPLKKITLIGGKNDVGKTTFMEALFLYLDYHNPEVFNKFFIWRMFIEAWSPKEIWKKFFYNSDFSKEIRILVNSNNGENGQVCIKFLDDYETSVQFPVTEGKITTIKNNFPALEIVHLNGNSVDYQAHILCQGMDYNYLKEIDKLQGQLSVFYLSERINFLVENVELLGSLDKADEQDKILPLLKLFEPNLIRLQLIKESGHNLIYADLGNKKKIPVNMLGDGFCRCLTMALILATKNANIFLIDEIGSGIHYSFQEDLWEFLVKATELYDCQIIATTHSYDTIKAFNNIISRNDSSNFSYIRLGKSKDTIKAYNFDPDSLSYSLSSELEVR